MSAIGNAFTKLTGKVVTSNEKMKRLDQRAVGAEKALEEALATPP